MEGSGVGLCMMQKVDNLLRCVFGKVFKMFIVGDLG